jgi:hypothetical protein
MYPAFPVDLNQSTSVMSRISLKTIAYQLSVYQKCSEEKHGAEREACKEAVKGILNDLPKIDGVSSFRFNWNHSTEDKLIFHFTYWHEEPATPPAIHSASRTQHTLEITPRFGGFNLRITGEDHNFMKTVLYEEFLGIFK